MQEGRLLSSSTDTEPWKLHEELSIKGRVYVVKGMGRAGYGKGVDTMLIVWLVPKESFID